MIFLFPRAWPFLILIVLLLWLFPIYTLTLCAIVAWPMSFYYAFTMDRVLGRSTLTVNGVVIEDKVFKKSLWACFWEGLITPIVIPLFLLFVGAVVKIFG